MNQNTNMPDKSDWNNGDPGTGTRVPGGGSLGYTDGYENGPGGRYSSSGSGLDIDDDDYPVYARRKKDGRSTVLLTGLVVYIFLMLAAVLLSSLLNRAEKRRHPAGQETAGNSTQIAGGDAGSATAGNGQNTADGQNGEVPPAQPGAGAEQVSEDEIRGDTYYASDTQPVQEQNVPAPEPAPAADQGIPVESISISGDATWIRQGEILPLFADISPDNATDPTVYWRTSNEAVAKVTQEGDVIAVGGGPVVIYAESSNGLVVDYPMDVSLVEKRMILTVSYSMDYNADVGDDWDLEYSINGTTVSDKEAVIVVLGDDLTVETTITEDGGLDESPDIGTTRGSFLVDEDAFWNGFEIEQEIFIQEDDGEYEGNEAGFTVTYHFSNAVVQ